jgi:ribulose kinase
MQINYTLRLVIKALTGFNMKITFNSKALVVGAALVMAVAAIGYFKTSPLCQDGISKTSNELCQNVQQNWISWIKGDSRSTQFHFVDFLELLNRLTPTSGKAN